MERPSRASYAERGEEGLGVLGEDAREDVLGIALRLPLRQQALVGEERIVGAEHDAVLEPA